MVRPIDRNGRFAPDVLDSIRAYSVNPQARSFERQIVVPIQTKPQMIPAGASGAIDFAAYLGPRKREILANPYYTALSLDKTLVIAFGPCAFCTFDGLIRVLFAVLKFFHSIVGDWGLSIILLVCLVRGLLHPITKWSQMNMLKLGKLGPEMKKLQEKYKGDKEGMARAQMELMKQQGATPVMGCLPMFLQMPIWIALWQALNTTFDLRHQPFLYGITWIDDLSKPDHLIDFANFGWPTLHLLWGMLTISGLNILPLILAVIFYIQVKIQPQPANLSPEQEQQQKIMKWMMIGLFPIFLYGSPSGLCIYIITSTIIGIIESKRIRKQFERKEEEAKRLALVDGATPSLQRQPAKPKKGLAAWLEHVQNQAMEMQKQAEAAKKQQQNRKK
jgi:YidC/Oxa1 family membrane protein insertase